MHILISHLMSALIKNMYFNMCYAKDWFTIVIKICIGFDNVKLTLSLDLHCKNL